MNAPRVPAARALGLMALLLVAAGCTAENTAGPPPVRVVATTSILGDITRRVAGDAVEVDVLIPAGTDPHSFQASARQVAELASADLVVANGLRLETALLDILEVVEADGGRVVEVAPRVDPLPYAGGGKTLDPHVWLDPIRGGRIAAVVADELQALAPPVGGEVTANAIEYQAELQALDDEITQLLTPIDKRQIVTNHDALGYWANRYGLEIVGTIIPSGATLAEPSSRDLAGLVETINELRIGAIFADTTSPARLAQVLAEEAGLDVQVVELYTGSLGPEGSGAATYIDMLRLNATRIAEALT